MKIFNYKKLLVCSILLALLSLNSVLAEENSSSSNEEDQYIINEDNVDLSDIEKKFIIAINKYRESEGKTPFKINSSLMNEARKQSSMMIYYGQRHYLYRTENKAKESIYYGPKSIDVVINGLKNSPSNKDLLVSDTMTYIGVGIVNGNNNYYGSWAVRYAELNKDNNKNDNLVKETVVKTQEKPVVKKEEENKNQKEEIASKKEDTNTTLKDISIDTSNSKQDVSKEEESNKELVKEANPYLINPEDIELTPEEEGMIIAVNQHRAYYKRSILIVSKVLMYGARQQSRLMLSYGQNHWLYSPYGANAENIFRSPRTLNGAMNGFKRSSAHNGNMLNPYHTHIGVGAIVNGYVGSWTQRFARFRINKAAKTI